MTTPIADPDSERRSGPLAGSRVLEFGSSTATAYAAKLLGDLGADVLKIEPPNGGDPSRDRCRSSDGDQLAASAEFLYFNTSKRSVALQIDDASPEILAPLLESSDIVILAGRTDSSVGPFTIDELAAKFPRLIITCVSPFGSTGPYRDFQGNPLALAALGCWAATCGAPDREPLQPGGSLADTVTGAYAALAALGGLELRERTQVGDVIDVCGHEAALTCTMLHPMRWDYWEELDGRHSDYMTGPSYFVECTDGYLGINVLTTPQWELQCAFIGRGEFIADESLTEAEGRLAAIDLIREATQQALGGKSTHEAFHQAQEWRLPFGLVPSPSEALELEPHRARDYFLTHDIPGIGPIRTPRVPFVMGASPSAPTPPPELGNATDAVMQSVLGIDAAHIQHLRQEGVIG
ncbi:MAG: CaiB/BaiF CoA transferase family protein [Cumulibacter sp.]